MAVSLLHVTQLAVHCVLHYCTRICLASDAFRLQVPLLLTLWPMYPSFAAAQ